MEMVNLVEAFGFKLSRNEGSHHIFTRTDIPELVNLQDVKGQARTYQIRRFLKLVTNTILNRRMNNARLSYQYFLFR